MKIFNLQGKEILEISGDTLRGANLRGADLQDADLQDADLRWANLQGANLRGANLRGADLQDADLQDADLRWANLQGANLRGADLAGANLRWANLQGANLRGANLRGADLQDADLPHYKICPEVGGFYAWKKTTTGIIKIYIPANAKRINPLTYRKCRASKIKVISGPGCGGQSPTHYDKITYEKNQTYQAHEFNDDIRMDCAPGIHFFMTEKEAKEWY